VFVHDRLTGVTERVSVASDGTEGNGDSFRPSISADGRFVAFDSGASNLVTCDTNQEICVPNQKTDIFVHDRCASNGNPVAGCTRSTERVSVASDGTEGSGFSVGLSISAVGRFVAFERSDCIVVNGVKDNVYADVLVYYTLP